MSESLKPQPAIAPTLPPRPPWRIGRTLRLVLIVNLVLAVAMAVLVRVVGISPWFAAVGLVALALALLPGFALLRNVLINRLWTKPAIWQSLVWAIPMGVGLWSAMAALRVGKNDADAPLWSFLLGDASLDPAHALAYRIGLWSIVVVCACHVIIGVVAHLQAHRRAVGKWTKQDRERQDWVTALVHARDARRRVLTDEALPVVRVPEVQLRPGETCFADGLMSYARFYGVAVNHTAQKVVFSGPAVFVASGLIGNAISDGRNRSKAYAAAQQQWREHQEVRVIVTDQRLLIRTAQTWLTFDHAAAIQVRPNVKNWNLVIEYESCEPLFLGGKMAPLTSVLVLSRFGAEAVAEAPGLEGLIPDK